MQRTLRQHLPEESSWMTCGNLPKQHMHTTCLEQYTLLCYTALVCMCRIKGVLETPWLPHLLHLKLQDNLITHVAPLSHLTLLQTLDLSFNHIQDLSVIQGLSTSQQLQFLRVNDNPVQHEPGFFFTLQRLLPWTQHEFGHARRYPDDQQIKVIQQQAVLGNPLVVQVSGNITFFYRMWSLLGSDVPHHAVPAQPRFLVT